MSPSFLFFSINVVVGSKNAESNISILKMTLGERDTFMVTYRIVFK